MSYVNTILNFLSGNIVPCHLPYRLLDVIINTLIVINNTRVLHLHVDPVFICTAAIKISL